MYYTGVFISYHFSIDNRWCLLSLLPNKSSIKTKANMTILERKLILLI